MTRLELLGCERVRAALHVHWNVERDDEAQLLATVIVPSPRAAHAFVHTPWGDGTGDDDLDAHLVRRTNAFLAHEQAAAVAGQWRQEARRLWVVA
jgi:hypothetical protein